MPFIWLVSTAFKSNTQNVYSFPPTFLPKPPVLDNFMEAWKSVPFGRYLFNSFALIVILVPAHLFLTALTAYPFIIFFSLVGGFPIFLMRQAYLGVPKEIEEAATIDGCGFFRTWWSIVLPMVKPTVAALSIISFVNVWNSFMWPLIILNDDKLYPLSLGLAYLSGAFGFDVRIMAAGLSQGAVKG